MLLDLIPVFMAFVVVPVLPKLGQLQLMQILCHNTSLCSKIMLDRFILNLRSFQLFNIYKNTKELHTLKIM